MFKAVQILVHRIASFDAEISHFLNFGNVCKLFVMVEKALGHQAVDHILNKHALQESTDA